MPMKETETNPSSFKKDSPNQGVFSMLVSSLGETYRRLPLTRRVWLSFALVLAVGAANAWVSVEGVLKVAEDNARLIRTHQAVEQIHEVMECAAKVESDSRGYAITGKEEFLKDIQKCTSNLPVFLQKLKDLSAGKPDQMERFVRLEPLLRKKVEFVEETIRLRRQRGREATLGFITHGKGPGLMDGIRSTLDDMRSAEERFLLSQTQDSQQGISAVRAVFITLDAVIFLFLCFMIYLMTRDLVHQEEIHRTIQHSEEKFKGLLEAAPDALVIVDGDGKIRLANAQAEKMFGWPRETMVGQPIESLVPDRFKGSHQRYRADYSQSPQARLMGVGKDLFALRKDGTEFPAEISLSPLRTPEGVLVIAAIRDATERRRLLEEENRRIHEASRLKSEFLANMSHELRTPLNAIIGFSELMFNEKVGPMAAEHKEYLGDILNSSRHLLQIINDVLDLSKIEAGRMDFKPEAVDLAAMVSEIKGILRGMAAQKNIYVEEQMDSSLSKVVLDGAKFKQVLYNYLSNAIKFTEEGGWVTVRMNPVKGGFFRLEVEDNGIGIQAGDIPRLFTEFTQLNGGISKKYAGTGLGLALVKRLVEAQGGTVGVKSTPGKGSVFFAELPRETVFSG